MPAAVVPVLVPDRIRGGAPMSLRSLFRLPRSLLRILPIGRRNVRSFRVRVLDGNLRGCRSFDVGCYRKDGSIGRLVDAPGYAVEYRLVSSIRRLMGVAAHLRGVYRLTPHVLSPFVLLFPSFVRETAPSRVFP